MAFMVDERMAYHRQIGFDHFDIYDNNSTDHLAASTALTSWPWRRSENQAYLHVLAFTWARCHWTFHADIDYYLLPLVSPPTVQVIVAHVRRNSKCASSVVEMRFEGLRTHHDNLTTCPDTPVIETYVHRRTDKDAYDLGFGLVICLPATSW
ncbi:uncharacterized protein ACA1_221760 [Acanthamoeba castellanii str. Neff]|uniref:Glycosyltransferase family 92 protein n=1 Tax=Acanthamoeba castellanii (strain ATCC 30010 / Neff) TaxID=1257118 RepID=L8GSL0_ACACF|nr:uncharacterized protein ACA1_221760 [Acanthamoeba castellanii str. Neff]ELR15990.1 hypothetical protein ACA1_221760 [Acanthamoeba castellanii str. Neff]